MTAPWLIPPTGARAQLSLAVAGAVPVLETARLRLRAPSVADFPAYHDILNSPRWHEEGPAHEANSWYDFCGMIAGWLLHGSGIWSVEERASGALVGFIPLHHEIGDPEIEIGWFATDEAEGKGYITEAARAALNYAFDALGDATVVSYIPQPNPRSVAVAERLGARRDPAAEEAYRPRDPETAMRIYRHNPKGKAAR